MRERGDAEGLVRTRPYANLRLERSLAFRISSSRSRGGAFVWRESMRRRAAAVTSSTARSNAASLAREGRVVPLSLRTNWSAEAWTSSSVAGGSKFASVLMFLHIVVLL